MNPFTLARCAVIVTCALAPALAVRADAQAAPTPSPSPTPLTEIGRVVTSDRQDEPLRDAARTTFVVTKAEIVARGYLSVADALTTIPGVTIERYGGLGSAANVGIRGSSSAQVLVLIDGRPAGGAETETLDLGSMSTSGVERIEIVEGGGATLYGAGAIGGVINIITTHPDRAPLVIASTGSFDAQRFDLETQNISFERLVSANGYGYVGTSVPSGNRVNADVESTNARLRGATHFGKVRVDGSLGLSDVHLGVPGPIALPFSSPAPNPALPANYQSSTTRQNTLNADARATFTLEREASTTTLDLSATRQSLLFYSSAGDPLGCFTPQGTQPCEDLNQEGRVQASLRTVIESARQRIIYGVDLAHGEARVDAGGGEAPANGFAQMAAYAQDSVTAGAVQAYAGVRGERDGGYGGVVAPSIGGILPLSSALTARTNFAVGFRAPDLVDLYYPGFSNPNLQPEKTQNFDASLSDSRMLGTTTLTYFELNGDNLIIANPHFNFSVPNGPGNEYLVNAQHASIAGFTLDARTPAFNGFTTTLGITDLYRALDLTGPATRLVGRPVFSTSVALEYATRRRDARIVSLGVIARSMGARSHVPAGGAIDPTQYAAAFTSIDAYVRVRVAQSALLSLRGANLGNERYSDIASPPYGGYPAPGRSFTLELSTR